jgi:predicted CxxxxCH...CXXCH cytochrome family protein
MMNSRKLVWSNLRVITSLIALGIAAFSGNTVQAGTQYNYNCEFCHRMPPLDSATGKREAGSGAVKGNHQSHAGTTAASCVKCHGPALTAAGHRDKLIQVQGNINASPKGASYSRGFFNQTSVPPAPLGSCSNVNCHFEQTSPTWGSAAYSSPAGCVNCHGAPPAGGVTGSAGSHARHDSYFSGPAQCVKCHPNRLAEARPFGHATSAATARVKVTLSDPAGAASGSYSGTGANFLPSQGAAQVFGACSNNYCHSTGNPNVAPASLPAAYAGSGFASATWGSGALSCNACHGRSTTNGMPDYTSGTPGSASANSHLKHVTGSSISCNECHERSTKNNGSIRAIFPSAHVNKAAEVFFNLSGANKAGVYAAAVGSKSCSNTYCHGSAAIQWGGASLSCTSCHGASNAGDLSAGAAAGHALHVNSPTAFSNLTGSSQTSASAYVFSCKSCHPTTSHATGPASALSAAAIGGSALAAAQYTAGATSLGDSKGFKYTAGTCSTNSCHSNGRGGAPLVTASWSAAATGSCLSCHDGKQTGATASTLSARHDRHMNPTGNALIGLNNGLNCVDCHAKTVSGNTTVGNKTRHVNGYLDYSGLRAGGSARYSTSTKQCSNIYCHSNGNPGALVYVNMTGSKAWSGTATLGCNGCHGRSGSLGAPDYLNGGAAPLPTANSHAKHVAGAADTTVCATCHLKTANASLGGRFKDYTAASYHLNGTSNVHFSAAKAGTGATFTPASGTCNNVTCHGGTGSSVVWGGSSVNCQDCHGNGATASVADFGASFWNNGTASKFQMTGTGSWADTGHGRPTASGNYPGSANPPANFAGVTNFCEWCHDSSIGHNVSGNPFRLRNWSDATWGKNGVCMLCHATGSAGVTVGGQLRNSASNKVGAYHYGAKHSTALSGGQYCWDCHDPHGAGNSNQFMIRQQVALGSDAVTGAPSTQSAAAVIFTLSATPTGTDYAKSAAPFNGICNVCHTTTGHYTTAAGDAHNSGTRCTTCHSHDGDGINKNTAFTPVGGGVSTGGSACFSCHGNFQPAMSVTGSARTGSYHHVLGTSASDLGDLAPGGGSYSTSTGNLYCTSCHADHNYFNNGGTVTTKGANLRSDIANASGAAPVNTDFLATGSNGICVSCHSASLARDSANQAAGGVATTPVIAGAIFAASMHNYTTMSSFGTQQFAANCVKCHSDEQAKDKQTSANKFGPHISASVSLLDDLGTGTNAQYREQTMCFRCHSQASDTALGGTLKAVTGKDWFGSSTMRGFAEDTFKSFTSAGRSPRHKISKYTGLHKANETLADLAANKHVECADCHSPHAAKFGNHSSTRATTAKGARGNTLAGVLTGASGVTVTAWGAASPTTAWGLNATSYGQTATSTLPAATLEYQVCFKCHTKAMGATGWFKNMTSAGQMGGKNLTWTDLSVEFNPNNAARHPIGTALGVASQLTAARLSGGWTPGSVMTCSDCHSTDSTASKGPHGSAVKWMLAGTNKAWPYSTAAGNGGTAGTLYRIATYSTGAGTKDGLFCLNCHTIRPASGVNNWHSNSNVTAGQHGSNAIMACVSCHIRVPHGGKISRLLQTTNAPARYKSNANGASANFGGWGTSTVNIKGSSFSSANFKSSCGEHSSGASGGEAW